MTSEESRVLELILLYSMDEIEAKALKIAYLYLEKSKKFFPDYKHYRLPKGDPRKSDLFRQCHKLLREKGNKIADEDFRLYVHAQLDILSHIKKGDIHPCITPSCLAGEKAWKRWLLWKSRYDKLIESKASASLASSINIHDPEKIKRSLWKTKQFLLAWFDRLEKSDIEESIKDKNLFLWYQTGSVCGYYFLLSPLVNDWIKKNKKDIKKEFGIDINTYKEANQVMEYFKEEFKHEFC